MFWRDITEGWKQRIAVVAPLLTSGSIVARLTPTGWNVTMSIPFASLTPGADAPAAGSVWRANFYRIDRPTGEPRELTAWSPTLCGTYHTPGRFGYLEF